MHFDKEREPLVSVIVPFYNEEHSLAEVFHGLGKIGKEMRLEIVAVDDGSTDNSRKTIKELPYVNVNLICHRRNFGKGKAIATGVAKSKGEIIVIQDADCEYPPEEIPKLVKPIIEGKADIVFGSRFLSNNNNSMTVSHRLGNIILSLATSILYNVRVTDVMTGHKSFLRKTVETIDLLENGFEIEVELTSKLLEQHLKLKEVPINYFRRRRGKSKISYKDGLKCLLKLLSRRIKGNKAARKKQLSFLI